VLAAAMAAAVTMSSGAQALTVSDDTFILSFDVTSLSTDVIDAVIFTSNPVANSGSSGPKFDLIPATVTATDPTDPFPLPKPASATKVMLLGVTTDSDSVNHLALFTNTGYSGGSSDFNTQFSPADEGTLIAALLSETSDGDTALNSFVDATIATIGFTAGSNFNVVQFSGGTPIGNGISSVAALPLPATLPMMVSGLAGIGFAAYRRRKQQRAA